MTLVFYYTGNLLCQTALTILLISVICRYNPEDHRSVIFQRLMYAGLLWAGFDLCMALARSALPPEKGFMLYCLLSFMFLAYPPLAIQTLLSLVWELSPRQKMLIAAPYVLLYLAILFFPHWASAATFGIAGGYEGPLPPWNTGFKLFSLVVPLACLCFVLYRSVWESDPVARKGKQLLCLGGLLFMGGLVVSQVIKQAAPALPWFANLFSICLGITAFFSLKKYGRVLSGQTLFETIVKISPSGIACVRNMEMIWANPSMQTLLALPDGERGSVREIFPGEQPPGMDRETILQGIDQGSLTSRMVHVRAGGREPLACLVNCSPLEPGSPENGVLMILSDVTEESRIRRELSELNRQLEKMAHTDSLTQIANRRRFDRYLDKEWQRARREHRPLSLVLLDVDFFKNYNDLYGHPAGDGVLRLVGQEIKGPLNRPGDLACRIGGEEFALILPETPIEGAVLLADRIRRRILSLGIEHQGSEAASVVTVSAGITCTSEFDGLTPGGLIRQADQALYQAKEKGRNRCQTFQGKPPANNLEPTCK